VSGLTVVYLIACSCGKVHINETSRKLEQRMKEYQDASRKGDGRYYAIAEHSWNKHYSIAWQD